MLATNQIPDFLTPQYCLRSFFFYLRRNILYYRHGEVLEQASQTEDFKDSLKDIGKNADSKYLPSRKMDTTGVAALYGCISRGNGRIACGKRPIDTTLDSSLSVKTRKPRPAKQQFIRNFSE